jgi:Secretion system C-terminal sorting domain
MKPFFLLLSLLLAVHCLAQGQSKRVLFIGNSYIYSNDLPGMLVSMAASTGDTLVVESNNLSSYTLQLHATNAITLAKIMAGGWDYVIIQAQSQEPAFPLSQVEMQVFPYAKQLDSLVNLYNPCAETVFFMTWGRQNGDAGNCPNWPPVCTYLGMDSLLNQRYRMMAEQNNAILSPVGEVWRYIRANNQAISLYVGDGSHPTPTGTYLAACSFYAVLLRKDPSLIGFLPPINPDQALAIRNATKAIVYDQLPEWHVGEYDPTASFSVAVVNDSVVLTNTSSNATSYTWDLGNGETSTEFEPSFPFINSDPLTISLVASHCDLSATATGLLDTTVTVGVHEVVDLAFGIYPNPASTFLNIDLPKQASARYEVIDLEGRILARGVLADDNLTVFIGHLADGLYQIKLYRGQAVLGVRSFIVNKP